MPVPDPTNRAAGAVLAALRELAGADHACSVPLRQISDLAELGRTRTKQVLAELEAAGLLEREHRIGGVTPVTYRLVTPVTRPRPTPVTLAEVTPVTLACTRDRSEPFSSLSASDNGNRRAPTGAPARARLPTPTLELVMPQPDPNLDAPAVTAIVAAVKACETAGKPPLDDAAKKRIGSVAKRMHKGGVTLEELASAAVYLVRHGMSDLQAAHRGRLEQDAQAIAGDELDELWLLTRQLWPRIPLPPPGDAAFWIAELAPVPVEFCLEAVARWARRTDAPGAFPPGVGQIRTTARKLFGEAILEAKGRAIVDREAALEAEHRARMDARAAGDPSDPRPEA